jgi:hypothetical protein
MADMSALLRIIARAEGKEAIEGVARSLGNLQRSGANTTRALEGIASSAGGLAGSMRSLVPLLSGAGLVALAQRSIETGDRLWDLSQRTGVSVERLSQLSKAARLGGTDIETVAMALQRMSRSMVAASDGTKALADRQDDEMRRAVDVVQRGERAQTQLVKEQASARLAVLDRESEARLRALGRRYRREEQLLSDRADDLQGEQERQLQAQENAETRAAQRRFDAQRRAITADRTLADEARQNLLDGLRDQEERATGQIRDAYALRSRELQRSLRDQRQQQQDAIDDRRSQEEQEIRASVDQRKSGIKAQTDATIEGLKAQALARIEALKGGPAGGEDMEGLNTSKAANAYRELGIAVRDSRGQLRSSGDVLIDVANRFQTMADGVDKAALAQQLFGRGGAQLIPMLNQGGEAISRLTGMSTAQARASDELSDAMETLQMRVGGLGGKLAVALMPSLEVVTNNLIGMIDAFNRLDPGMQAVIGYGAAIAIAWGPLMGIIINTAKVFALLQGGIALLTGGGVVSGGLAALVAIVTGPVGIIAALVAAGVAAYVFRDQIGDAIAGLGDMWINAFEAIINFSRDIFNQIIQSFDSVVNTPFGIFLKALRGDWGGALMSMAALALGQFKGIGDMIGSQLRSAFTSAASAVQGIWNGMLQGIRNAINSVFAGINKTINDWISGINSVIRAISSTTRVSLPQVPLVSIPRFATGAYVTGRTIAELGDGGEPEYAIPASKMASASAAYLGGARGVAVLNGSVPGGGRPVVNIQAGPVMQQADGSRWVSLDDAAAMVRQAVDQLRGELAQPSSRAALGVG